MIARYKPQQPVIVPTTHPETYNKMLLVYGCYPLLVKPFKGSTQLVKEIGPILIKNGILSKNDRFVVTAGIPFGTAGSTNIMIILTA
jgi:pyruvate kinase